MKYITCVALIHLAFLILPIYHIAIAKTKRDNMFKYEKKIHRAVYAIGLTKLIGFGYLSILLHFLAHGSTTLAIYLTSTAMVGVFYLGLTMLTIHVSFSCFGSYPLMSFLARNNSIPYVLGVLMFTILDFGLLYFYYFVNLEWILTL